MNWNNTEMMAFFQHAGFVPAPRLALDQVTELRSLDGDTSRVLGARRLQEEGHGVEARVGLPESARQSQAGGQILFPRARDPEGAT